MSCLQQAAVSPWIYPQAYAYSRHGEHLGGDQALQQLRGPRDFNNCVGQTMIVPLMLPNQPTKHERELYRSLVSESVAPSGAGIDLKKMLQLWCKAVTDNLKQPKLQQKQLRHAHLESLAQLRERMEARQNQYLSGEATRDRDAELRESLRQGDRHHPSFERAVPTAPRPLSQPAVLPSAEALAASQFHVAPPHSGLPAAPFIPVPAAASSERPTHVDHRTMPRAPPPALFVDTRSVASGRCFTVLVFESTWKLAQGMVVLPVTLPFSPCLRAQGLFLGRESTVLSLTGVLSSLENWREMFIIPVST
mmetsp:Transcript_12474/g.30135  ORF Transcript_12474/g.30135 Transcript_12474/m.30135 type:complete len:307 (+) Transcript_12474:384-1304(+)